MTKINKTTNRNGLSNIVRKEFIDHIKSGKFIIVFIIFLLGFAYSLHTGIEMYNTQLEMYKEHIAAPPIEYEMGDFRGGWEWKRPSVLSAFMWTSMALPILGAILAVVMGFDIISKERQDRTLKTLLSHPIYRDEIINGKAIGGMLTIIVAIGITFAICIAMLLLSDIVPTINEFISIGLFGILSIIMLVSYFSIALMSSVLFKNSGFSIVFTLGLIFVIGLILPLIGLFASELIIGPAPEMPEWDPVEFEESIDYIPIEPVVDEEFEEWRREMDEHWSRTMAVTEAFAILDPGTHFGRISTELGIGMDIGMMMGEEPVEDPDIFDKLGAVWMNILALFVIPTIFFAIAYTKFMKLDIR